MTAKSIKLSQEQGQPKPPKPECKTDDQIERFLINSGDINELEQTENHLEICDACQSRMEHLAGQASFANLVQSDLKPSKPDRFILNDITAYFPKIPGFDVLNCCGLDDHGVTFKAIELESGRFFAVKWLLGKANRTGSMKRSPIPDTITRLNHAGIVKVFRIHKERKQSALIMEWVKGGTLQDSLDLSMPSEPLILELFIQLTKALEYAFDHGLIHRFFNRSTILLVNGDLRRPKLSSFSLPNHSDLEALCSSTLTKYLSHGSKVTKSKSIDFGSKTRFTDAFTLGTLLYEILAGLPPFQNGNSQGSPHLRQNLKHSSIGGLKSRWATKPALRGDRAAIPIRYYNPQVDRTLETICLKCLEKLPEARYLSFKALREDLERYQAGLPISARPPSAACQALRWVRCYAWLAKPALTIIALLLTIVYLIGRLG